MVSPDSKIIITVSYIDKTDPRWYGQDYGLCEGITDLSKADEAVLSMLSALKKDYNARRKGENDLWP